MRMLTSALGSAHRMLGGGFAFAQLLAPSSSGPCSGRRQVGDGARDAAAAEDAGQPGGIGKRGGLTSTTMRLVGVSARRAYARKCASISSCVAFGGRIGRLEEVEDVPARARVERWSSNRIGLPGCGGWDDPASPRRRRRARCARSPRTRAGGRTRPPDRESSRSRRAAGGSGPALQSISAPLRGNSTVGGSMPTLTNTGWLAAPPWLNTSLCQPLFGLPASPGSSVICAGNVPLASRQDVGNAIGDRSP